MPAGEEQTRPSRHALYVVLADVAGLHFLYVLNLPTACENKDWLLRRTVGSLPFRDSCFASLGPQTSLLLLERRAASFASVKDSQHVGYEENQ